MKNPSSLILKTILLFIIIGQVIIAGEGYSAVFLDKVVATVNGEVITWSELISVVEAEGAKNLEGLEGEEKENMSKELQNFFLNSMIDVKLQLIEARRLGFKVTDTEIESAMTDVREKYNLSAEAFITSLKSEGFTVEDYKERLSEQILLSKISGYRVNSTILITDGEIQEYYNSDSGSEEIRIRQVFFKKPEDDAGWVVLGEKAEQVIMRIKSGENFAALAMELSEDQSREYGGDLGFVARGTVLKEVEDMAFALETGKVSSPFRSSAGLHIIKVEDRRKVSGQQKPEEKVRNILFQRKYNEKYDQWIKMLRENAYIEVNL